MGLDSYKLLYCSKLVRQAFDAPMHEPPPATLVATILGAQPVRASRLLKNPLPASTSRTAA